MAEGWTRQETRAVRGDSSAAQARAGAGWHNCTGVTIGDGAQ